MASRKTEAKPPLDDALWAEAERATEEHFAEAQRILDRSYREGGSQPPPADKAAELINRASLEIALTRGGYASRWAHREIALLHERVARLERPPAKARAARKP